MSGSLPTVLPTVLITKIKGKRLGTRTYLYTSLPAYIHTHNNIYSTHSLTKILDATNNSNV